MVALIVPVAQLSLHCPSPTRVVVWCVCVAPSRNRFNRSALTAVGVGAAVVAPSAGVVVLGRPPSPGLH